MFVIMTSRPLALALASASVLAFALLSALFTSRGPVTAQQALVTMVVALLHVLAFLLGRAPHGLLAAQRRPELHPAFIGSGQMVGIRETDQLSFEDTLAWSRSRRHADTYARPYPQVRELELRQLVPVLEVPVWLVMGAHEARGRDEAASGMDP